MRKLAVCVNFMSEPYRSRIEKAAAELGFTPAFYRDSSDGRLGEDIGGYEVIFGHPAPAVLKRAERLRWLCSDCAGIEAYLDSAVWPHPDCLLSNGSGAYGPTISEHILMVLLMLLRRMPEYQAAAAERQWPYLRPIRSIGGSRVVMLGTGDIGSHTARRGVGCDGAGAPAGGPSPVDVPQYDHHAPHLR